MRSGTKPVPNAPFLQLVHAAMSKMMAGMTSQPTGDANADFAAWMVPHHQGAIEQGES
jgi:uncharacterized protein (DUF305 family)